MHSRLAIGSLVHGRKEPVAHAFTYPFYSYCLDLDELTELSHNFPLFGLNRFRPVSFYERDYIDGSSLPLKEKVLGLLKRHGCREPVSRIELVTVPRFFGYIFNPVSFYFCFDASGGVRYHIAEINNTYRERHIYVLGGPKAMRIASGSMVQYRIPKEFFVSPFNLVHGEYDIGFAEIQKEVDVRFNIIEDGRTTFVSRMSGKFIPITSRAQILTICRFPLSALLTMPRIFWQAQKLRFQKCLPMFWKPNPRSDETLSL